ncbi:MAG: ABC transporter permease [Candidatus Taylorbacteria bacterium]|nr:ABC transporter permease [Candidatus Taylorbacteria bacterium]
MAWHRINALIIRHLYLYKRSLPRLMDILFWPFLELLLWGFLSMYLRSLNLPGANIVTVLLGAVIFWGMLNQAQRAVSVSFLEDVWEKNFLNLFVSPLSLGEFIVSRAIIGIIQIVIVGLVSALTAFILYQFNLFTFGFALIPFVLELLVFGWTLGLFTIAIIFRWGTDAQIIAFSLLFMIQPFSAVFYPVSALPAAVQWISYLLPSTYVFEGMRNVIETGQLPIRLLILATVMNLLYLIVMIIGLKFVFNKVKAMGRLLKMD